MEGKPMKCRDLDELISAYADGELPETRRQFIEEHLSSCTDCHKVLTEYTGISRQIKSLQVPAVPDFKEKFLSEVGKPGFFTLPRRWAPSTLIKVLIPGILISVLATSLYFLLPFGDNNSTAVMARIYTATEDLSSYQVTCSFYVESEGTEQISQDLDISYMAPSYYDIKLTGNNNITSEVFLDGENVYSLTPELTGADGIINFGNFGSNQVLFQQQLNLIFSMEDTLGLINSLTNLTKLPDAEIDGISCFHYRGDVDMVRYLENYWAKIVEQSPEVTDIPDPLWDSLMDIASKLSQQIEMWVGKDDYLMRQTEITLQYPNQSTVGHSVYHYYYPSNLSLAPPVNPSGEILPGWYLVTDSTFSRNIQHSIHRSGDSMQINVQVDVSNIGQQDCSNVRVYIYASDLSLINWSMYNTVADSADISLSPGEQQTYRAQLDFIGSDTNLLYPVTSRMQVFAEYTTGDGIERVEVLSH